MKTIVVDAQVPPERISQPAMARGRVVFEPELCRTCHVCETACAIHHEGEARPAIARIRIYYREFETENPISGVVCTQCVDAPCLDACRFDALIRDAHTGAVRVLEEKCTGCMRCQRACPSGIPQRHPERRVAIKCDLCSDRPQGPICVEMCPLSGRALRYEPDYYTRERIDD